MTKIKKILVPTDFSGGAGKAYSVAQKLASVFGSKIDLLHVIPTIKYLSESMKTVAIPLSIEKEIFPKIIDEAEHQLEQAMKIYITEENRGEGIVKIDRKPAETITEHAFKEGYDMIVMGARGKHESALFRGSTTARVIRNSKVPVFTVDEGMNEHNIRNILVPTDLSTLSFSAFPFAVQFAELFDSKLTLFHVLEVYGSIAENFPRNVETVDVEPVYETLISRLQSYLEENKMNQFEIRRGKTKFEDELVIKKDEEIKVLPLHVKIDKGISAHFEIEAYAEKTADLLIMATHGYSGLTHLILGSNAEKVAQYCKKPMITVRPEMLRTDDHRTV